MIIGIGVDLVTIKRFEKWLGNESLVRRYFHSDECVVLKKPAAHAIQSLAVRFAAKEAFGKALGHGLSGFSLTDVCVLNDERGKPELKVYGEAKKALEKSGANTVHLSLSHEKDFGVAFVVLEKI